jgi:hypothetical protein
MYRVLSEEAEEFHGYHCLGRSLQDSAHQLVQLLGWMRQSYHFQYRWIYGMGVLKRYVCIGSLHRQFLSAGETHILP